MHAALPPSCQRLICMVRQQIYRLWPVGMDAPNTREQAMLLQFTMVSAHLPATRCGALRGVVHDASPF